MGGKAPCIAVMGTGSDVGKSVVATALCRHYARQGVRVAPFKAQNMSNNSGVTPEGLEMGRAQIVQAEAAGIAPHVDMNPILLKPTSDVGAQVVVLGQARMNAVAKAYHQQKESLFKVACDALDRLRSDCELIVMEGAGSCAEVNLMDRDIVNLSMAAYAKAPVILVADIHRGGVFAQIVGTLACLPEPERKRIRGFIINRFRGDIALFDRGVRWIEKKTGRPVFGVLPWYTDIRIEPEDSVVIETPRTVPSGSGPAVAVIRLPHISNFNDFDPLDALPGLEVVFVERPQDLAPYRAVILPGSKNTRWDLQWLHDTGWADRLRRHARCGGSILGVCGGYQMLGRTVRDPEGLEGRPGETPGLDLLGVETELKAPKTTTVTQFSWGEETGTGYEIHMGETRRIGAAPLFTVSRRNRNAADDVDGAVNEDGRILGTYLHGLFDAPAILYRWLHGIGIDELKVPKIGGLAARDRQYDRLADHFRRYVNLAAIKTLLTSEA